MPGMVSWLVLIVAVVVLLIVAAFAFVVGLALWSGLCTGGVFLLRPKGKRWPWLIATIPLFVPAYLALVGVLIWQGIRPNPTYDFEYAFDMPVPATVHLHETKHEGWADYEDITLHFNATPTDIQTLTARGLTLDPDYGDNKTTPYNAPSGPIPWAQLEVYEGGSPDQRFSATDEARLIYNPSTGEAWYWYEGSD